MFDRQNVIRTILNARSLFRKDVWLQVACLIARDNYDQLEHGPGMRQSDALERMHHINWNVVEWARASADAVVARTPGSVPHRALCIVVLSIDMASAGSNGRTPRIDWSTDDISKILETSVTYGEIGSTTNVVVQICFKGLLCHGVDSSTMDESVVDEAVAVVVLDQAGMPSAYNIPSKSAGSVAYSCVALLMLRSTGREPSMILHAVEYTARTPSDDYLYASYITLACAEAICIHAFGDAHTPFTDLYTCRVSVRSAKPSRIVANMRFLMLLQEKHCAVIVRDLLLDEHNALYSFSRATLGAGAC